MLRDCGAPHPQAAQKTAVRKVPIVGPAAWVGRPCGPSSERFREKSEDDAGVGNGANGSLRACMWPGREGGRDVERVSQEAASAHVICPRWRRYRRRPARRRLDSQDSPSVTPSAPTIGPPAETLRDMAAWPYPGTSATLFPWRPLAKWHRFAHVADSVAFLLATPTPGTSMRVDDGGMCARRVEDCRWKRHEWYAVSRTIGRHLVRG